MSVTELSVILRSAATKDLLRSRFVNSVADASGSEFTFVV